MAVNAPAAVITPLFELAPGVELVLASASPRRRQFLAEWGVPFVVLPAGDAEPAPLPGEVPAAYAGRMAAAKARAVAAALAMEGLRGMPLVLAADTVVAADQNILGKPVGAGQALDMLRRLNGRVHEVASAVCLLLPQGCGQPVPDSQPHVRESAWGGWRQLSFSDVSRVAFHRWPDAVLRAYVATGEPADKAGAYAVQGQGATLVARVEGAWSTVVGLPVTLLARLLLRLGLMRPCASSPQGAPVP